MSRRDPDFDTRAVRAGTLRTEFNEHSEALFLTSSFIFDSAAQAAARFAGEDEGFVYSRFANPTVRMFEQKLASLEDGEDCIATASGMSAILATCLATLRAGDHVLCGASVFGATTQLFSTVLARFGIETTYVRGAEPQSWRDALRPSTRLMYCESPSNPLTELVDLQAFADAGRAAGALTVVDNCLCTPALQNPLRFGVDVVIHSATKSIDGQGRVLGGAIVGRRDFIHGAVLPVLRTSGPSLSPFNAWVLLKGLETLSLRMRAQSAAALRLARYLEAHPAVQRVYYPGLDSHPQAALAQRQQRAGGVVLSFDLRGAEADLRALAWRAIDAVRLMSITANLGDTRTTITHPASTTHSRLTAAQRQEAGIGEGMIRVAVGLESVDDLQEDLASALDAIVDG
jgi:O-succinylhomoserine sulfhydrylase